MNLIKIAGICLVLAWSSLLNSQDLANLQGLNTSSYYRVSSQILQRDLHIYVRVPDGEKDNTYPVVYLLDGGHTFPLLTSYATYLEMIDDIPAAIYVGISYGTTDWREGNLRSTDFTAPAKDKDHYGGATKFTRFLTQELKPMINKAYPVDEDNEILFGHSIGGQFVIYQAQFEPASFDGLIASNPALHRNLEYFLETPLNSKANSSRLFVMHASEDDPQFQIPLQKWLKHQKNAPWLMKVANAQDHNHFSSLPLAFRQGMKWLLSKE